MADEPKTRGPKAHYTMTAEALASRRANLEKAHAAPKDKIYHQTEKRLAASRANMAKAIAARKAPRGNASARMNALSSGLFVKDVAGSVHRMGEDPKVFRQHHALFFRVFAPQDAEERLWVQRLADINWKRLRFLRAQATWELERLKKALQPLAAQGPPWDAKETLRRAYIFDTTLSGFVEYIGPLSRFQSRMDRELRKLLKKRSGGLVKYYVPRVGRDIEGPLETVLDKFLFAVLKPPRQRSKPKEKPSTDFAD